MQRWGAIKGCFVFAQKIAASASGSGAPSEPPAMSKRKSDGTNYMLWKFNMSALLD